MKFLIISYRVDTKLPTISNVYQIEAKSYSDLTNAIANNLNDGDNVLMDEYGFISLDDSNWGNSLDKRFNVPQAHTIIDLT